MSETYQTANGEPVPSDVAETFDAANNWDRCDPQSVAVYDSLIGNHYHGIVDGKEQYVSENGYPTGIGHFDHVPTYQAAALPHDLEERFTYSDDVDLVHHDHYVEHVTRVIVVTETGRFSFGSRSGVVWGEYHRSDRNARIDNETKEIAMALVDATNDCGLPDHIQTARSGWHGATAFDKSDTSEAINALAKGDTPPEWDNDVYPYAVVFEDTRNVCSQPISIYGNKQFREQLQMVMENKRTSPGHATI